MIRCALAAPFLLDRHTFGKISWLVHIQPFFHGNIIGQILHNNGADKRGEESIGLWQYNMVVT